VYECKAKEKIKIKEIKNKNISIKSSPF